MAQRYKILLNEALKKPNAPIFEFPILTESDEKLLIEWSQTQCKIPNKTPASLFNAQAKKTPEHIAVSFGEQQLTYLELDEKANELAHYLQKQGVHPGSHVAIIMVRSPQLIVAIIAVAKAGGTYIPLDPSLPPERLNIILEDSDVKIVLTQSSLIKGWELSKRVNLQCLDQIAEILSRQPKKKPSLLFQFR